MRRLAMFVLALLVGCAATAPLDTPDSVLEQFRSAGLNVANVTTSEVLVAEIANALPSCAGARFDVEGDDGARVVICGKESEAEKLATYYTSLGESSPLFFSHVERRGGLVFQMSGSLPAETFQKYVAALS